MLILALLVSASAADVVVGGHLASPSFDVGQEWGLGLGARASRRIAPRWSVEGTVEGIFPGYATAGLYLVPAARFDLLTVDGRGVGLNAVAGPGLAVGYGSFVFGQIGIAGDVWFDQNLAGRLGLAARVSPDGPPMLHLEFGMIGRLLEREPPAPPPPPPPPPPVVAIDPGDALMWLPHPLCVWVPASDAAEWLPGLPDGTEVIIVAPGRAPQTYLLPLAERVVLPPAPEQGAAVIVASPGDRVTVGGVAVAIAADGVAVLSAAPGALAIEVVGGGRSEQLEAFVDSGYSVWVRAVEPEPVQIPFAKDSAKLGPAARERIASVLAQAGDTRFEVVGSFSPEGIADDNQRLAVDRASVVTQALIDAGLPADRVEDAGWALPEAGATYEEQRAAWIRPKLEEAP